MKIRNAQAAAVAALALGMTGTTVFAQTPAAPRPAAPAPPPVLSIGTPISGVCSFSLEDAQTMSKVGQFVEKRMDTIGQQVNAEVTGMIQQLQADAKAFETGAATFTQEQGEQKQLELRQREAGINRLVQLRQREIQVTGGKADDRIRLEVKPLFDLTIQERQCAVVLNGTAAHYVNPAMDITPLVVQKLDARITEFQFDKERLDQQAAGAPAGQAPPRAPATVTPGAGRATTPAQPNRGAPAGGRR